MNTSTQHHAAGHTMPGQGNAGIAKLDPAECDPARADCGSAPRKAGGDSVSDNAGPDIAADVKKHEQGHAKPERAVEKNPIDEAAWESFPASDPPSSNPGASAPAS